jgi:hypothetical protein
MFFTIIVAIKFNFLVLKLVVLRDSNFIHFANFQHFSLLVFIKQNLTH